MNLPHDGVKEKKLPEQAKGNPVYEQTPEDMPLWCCGRNCGRNSRLTVFVLSFIGIACSVWLCLDHDYFKFTSIRNDTFYDSTKKQPEPFEYATVAKVGLFWYQIDEVFIYPWPPPRERMLFRDMLNDELTRLGREEDEKPVSTEVGLRLLQGTTTTVTSVSVKPSSTPSMVPSMNPSTPTISESPTPAPSASGQPSLSQQPSLVPSASSKPSTSGAPSISTQPSVLPSMQPSGLPTVTAAPSKCVPPLEPGAGIDCELESKSPTMSPTSAPTITNPNDIVAATTQIGVRLKYPKGMDQFNSVFYNAQLGGILGPIFCGLAFITGLVEYCCCLFKCSWLPTAIFLYLAFMFQMFTLFLFLSDDFCKYDQDCRLGAAGFATVLAVICYFICQMLVCCTPRPPPLFNFMKPKPKRVKKRSQDNDGYDDGMYYDDDEYYDDEGFGDGDYYDDEGYDDDGTYDQSRYDDDTYDYTQNTGGDGRPNNRRNRGMGTVPEDGSYYDDDGYTQGYDDQSRFDDRTYDSQSFRTFDNQSNYKDDQYYDDGRSQQYDDGQYYDDGTQYDDGTRYDDGTQYDDGTRYDDGTQYDDGTRYDDGTQYDDQSRYDQGTYDGQSYQTYDNETQYDDDGYTQGEYSRDTRGID